MIKKYASSNLSSFESQRIKKDLSFALESQKLYRNKMLSLGMLATHLHTNTKYLSQVINQEFHCNFSGLINRFRIQEFKNRLLQGEAQQLTFYGLAQECGYNNRSTFYRAFRHFAQKTPKHLLINNS